MAKNNPDLTQTSPQWKRKADPILALYTVNRDSSHPVIPLTEAQLFLGRKPGEKNGIAFNDPRMSRTHAELCQLSSGIYTLYDRQSKNGTFHNGGAASGEVVSFGDVIRLGDTVLISARYQILPTEQAPDLLLGRSLVVRQIRNQIASFGPSNLTVLILGETGTGKELAARMIHKRSERAGAFVAVNCASIPAQLVERELFGHTKGAYTGATHSAPGFVDAAQNGTLFLDEVGDLPLEIQAKLLRFLEDRSYTPLGSTRMRTADVRVVAATNLSLASMVVDGRFREDLFARLEEATIVLPPLRERKEDLMLLIDHFIGNEGHLALNFDADVLEALALYDWPRNVRELEKVVRRLPFTLGGRKDVELDDLTEEIKKPLFERYDEQTKEPVLQTPSRSQLEEWLKKHKGNVSQLATEIDRDRKQIYRWLKRYDLDPKQYRDG